MRKKRVLFLVNHDIVIYNFRKEIVERLISEGYEIFISSPYGERIDYLIEMGCEFIELDIDRHGLNAFRELKLLKHYYDVIKEVNPSVILGFTIKPNIYGAYIAKKFKIPFVANITGLGSAVERKGFLQKFIISLYKISFANVQTIFFQNIENQQFFIDHGIGIGKHRLLPGSGVNLDNFQPLPYPSNDTIKFVFISRIMKQKGIDQYLEAAKYIKKEFENIEFHVCGFCEEEYENILNTYQDQGIIKYHGMLQDVKDILKLTHCTVHPTYYPEGISNVLLESAASERPIITTNRSGTREVVDQGLNGLLVKAKDSQDLIDKIIQFINMNYEERRKMGFFGRKKVEKEFNRDIVVKAYLDEVNHATR